jgi:hypothetical protein
MEAKVEGSVTVPGTVVQDVIVEAGSPWGRIVKQGQHLRIIDLEGRQGCAQSGSVLTEARRIAKKRSIRRAPQADERTDYAELGLSILERVVRCWHSNAYSSLFSSLFFFDFHRTNFSRFRRTFHSFDPVGFAIFANPAPTQPNGNQGGPKA